MRGRPAGGVPTVPRADHIRFGVWRVAAGSG